MSVRSLEQHRPHNRARDLNSVCGPNGFADVGAVLQSAKSTNACWIAMFVARTSSGTGVPAVVASIIAFVISKYWPPLFAAISCSSVTSDARRGDGDDVDRHAAVRDLPRRT